MAGSLVPVMYWAVCTTLCSASRSRSRAVAIPGGDATGQDPLDGAAVERVEDLGTHDKSFQSSEGEKVMLCPLHLCLGMFGP